VLRSFKSVLPSRIPVHNLVSISDFYHAFYMTLPLRPPSSDHPSDVLKVSHNYISSKTLPLPPSCPYRAVLRLYEFIFYLEIQRNISHPIGRSNYTSAYCNLRFLFGKLEDRISWMLLPRELQNMFRLRTLAFGVNMPEAKRRSHYFASHRFCYADVYISTQQIPWWQTIASNIYDLEIQVHSTRGIILFYITDIL
jgi:hypothetical protein